MRRIMLMYRVRKVVDVFFRNGMLLELVSGLGVYQKKKIFFYMVLVVILSCFVDTILRSKMGFY